MSDEEFITFSQRFASAMPKSDPLRLSPKDERIRSLEAMVAADGELIRGLREALGLARCSALCGEPWSPQLDELFTRWAA